jgi:hypothetical protein
VIYLLSLFCLLALIAFVQLRFAYRRRELGKRSWQTILASVEPVDVEGLRRISDNFLKPDREQLLLEPHEMWDIVGGLEGVARLRSNTTALLDLAVYAEGWSRMESRIIGEMIRRGEGQKGSLAYPIVVPVAPWGDSDTVSSSRSGLLVLPDAVPSPGFVRKYSCWAAATFGRSGLGTPKSRMNMWVCGGPFIDTVVSVGRF